MTLQPASDERQGELFDDGQEPLLEELAAAVAKSDRVYLKTLALNDWQWTDNKDAHQGGPFIPRKDRDSGFFPALKPKAPVRGMPIHEAFFDIHWPQNGDSKRARLVNYRSKGEETHLTGVVKEVFSGLTPASLFVLCRLRVPGEGPPYRGYVVAPESDAAGYLHDLFALPASFVSGVFEPAIAEKVAGEQVAGFLQEALTAFRAGNLVSFFARNKKIPDTRSMARLAQDTFVKREGLGGLDPFSLPRPGDAVMEISRDIEYGLFKEYQLRLRSTQILECVLGTEVARMSVETVFMRLISEYPAIDKIVSSAGQSRKSRAGYSFEHHLGRLLTDGHICHAVQPVIGLKSRADFILPSLATYKAKNRERKDALVLSAKTTLKERWRQVTTEIRNCDLYLATVDPSIASSVVSGMAENGIILVVPELLKESDASVYKPASNVISFKDFFLDEIKGRRPAFISRV